MSALATCPHVSAYANCPSTCSGMMCVARRRYQRPRSFFFFSSRRRHTRFDCDWSSDVCSSDLDPAAPELQMSVKDSASTATEVLVQQGRVLFRPDLAVDGVTVPPQVNTHQIVNIFASVKELKGDLAAKANIYLKEGTTVLDVINNFSITPLGSVGIVFSTVF